MRYISLPRIDRKPNTKRLLTFGIIVMLALTSLAVITVRTASASVKPFWYLPATTNFTTGTGSYREMIVAADPLDDSIPGVSYINTVGKSNFTVEISAPDDDGNASITVQQESISIALFFIRQLSITYLWGHIYATADGSGTMDTVGGNLKIDVFTTVVGDGAGGYTLEREFKNNVTGPSRVGDSLVYLPLEINVFSGSSSTDPTRTAWVDIYEPMPLYVTTGYSQVTIDDSAGPYPSDQSHPDMTGQTMSATGAPADPSTGIYTGVATGGNLDLYADVFLIGDTYSDAIFREVMVSEPKIPIKVGDYDGDGDVDLSDFYIFSGAYLTTPPTDPRCDLDGDDDVDLSDFYTFAGYYLT